LLIENQALHLLYAGVTNNQRRQSVFHPLIRQAKGRNVPLTAAVKSANQSGMATRLMQTGFRSYDARASDKRHLMAAGIHLMVLLNMARFEIPWLEDRSDDSVLEELRRVASLMPGRRLTKRVFDSHAKITSSAVERRFGSWTEATRRARLSDALPIYTEDAVLADLRRVSSLSQDESFTIAVYSQHGRYSGSHITRQFGGWMQALERAGLGHRYVGPSITERMRTKPGRAMSNDEILQRIRDVAARLGKADLSGADIAANSDITQSQLYGRFGSVLEALRNADVQHANHGRKFTEDEVFENLLNVWTHYGRPPTVVEMRQPPSTVGPTVYIRRYGGWRAALKAFVARANSDVDDGRSAASDEEPSTQAELDGSVQRPRAGIRDTVRPQSVGRAAARPHAARPTATSVQPEDRRSPSIGLRFKVLKRDHFKCVLCGDHPARNAECTLHVDHVAPWSKGGKTREDNLRTLCATCNIGRGNRFAD
jgi:hypothetical protein